MKLKKYVYILSICIDYIDIILLKDWMLGFDMIESEKESGHDYVDNYCSLIAHEPAYIVSRVCI